MSTAISKFRSRWENVILELLIFNSINNEPAYGGQLLTLAREKISMHIKIPTVYAILKRAVQLNLLIQTTAVEDEEKGITRGTARQYYTMTTQGHTYFETIKKMVSGNLETIAKITGGKNYE